MSAARSSLVYVLFRAPGKDAAERIMKKFPTFFHAEGSDLVFRSALDDTYSVGDHLKWLFGMLKFDGKFFRQMEASGVPAVLVIRTHTRPLCVEPEAMLLPHKLHLTTEIHLTK